jgi:hypothetical protein
VNADSRTPDSLYCESAEYSNNGFAKMLVLVVVTVDETTEVVTEVATEVEVEVTVFGGVTAR